MKDVAKDPTELPGTKPAMELRRIELLSATVIGITYPRYLLTASWIGRVSHSGVVGNDELLKLIKLHGIGMTSDMRNPMG